MIAIDHSAVWKENGIHTEGKKLNKGDIASLTEAKILKLQLGVINLFLLLLYNDNCKAKH